MDGKTHCRRGHLYTARNTKWYRGTRVCRICEEERLARKKRSRVQGKTLIEVFAKEQDKTTASASGQAERVPYENPKL
jgi:hypothetical protein